MRESHSCAILMLGFASALLSQTVPPVPPEVLAVDSPQLRLAPDGQSYSGQLRIVRKSTPARFTISQRGGLNFERLSGDIVPVEADGVSTEIRPGYEYELKSSEAELKVTYPGETGVHLELSLQTIGKAGPGKPVELIVTLTGSGTGTGIGTVISSILLALAVGLAIWKRVWLGRFLGSLTGFGTRPSHQKEPFEVDETGTNNQPFVPSWPVNEKPRSEFESSRRFEDIERRLDAVTLVSDLMCITRPSSSWAINGGGGARLVRSSRVSSRLAAWVNTRRLAPGTLRTPEDQRKQAKPACRS